MAGRRRSTCGREVEWAISDLGMEWKETSLTERAPAHPRTTAVSLSRGAPAERTCCVTSQRCLWSTSHGSASTCTPLWVYQTRERVSRSFPFKPPARWMVHIAGMELYLRFRWHKAGLQPASPSPAGRQVATGLGASGWWAYVLWCMGTSTQAQVAQPRGPTDRTLGWDGVQQPSLPTVADIA